MTDEDVQIVAEEIAAVVRERFSNTSEWAQADDAVADRLRALVSQAYGEAARALCVECAAGDVPAFRGGLWMHPDGVCKAGDVRDLKDSLCAHEWADARNAVVLSGEVCLKCGAVRAAPTPA